MQNTITSLPNYCAFSEPILRNFQKKEANNSISSIQNINTLRQTHRIWRKPNVYN